MIKNLIFDMGGVLIEYDPKVFLKRMGFNDTEIEIIYKEVCTSKYWLLNDLGEIDFRDGVEDVIKNIPSYLKEKVKDYIFNWTNYSYVIDGMEDLLSNLKKNGYKLYLLSNAGKDQSDYFGKYPYDKYFDGKIVSAFYHMIKPDKEIYELLINKFEIEKAESLFIDDNEANVIGANNVGIKAIRFIGVDDLKKQLLKLDIKIV